MKPKRAAHTVLRRLGVDLVRYDATRFPHLRRRDELRRLGVELVLDVGANTGKWASALRRDGYRGRIVSFEPLSGAFAELGGAAARDPLWECRRVALADADGEATFHVAQNSLSSSLLPMTARHLESAPESRETAVETVSTSRLDSIRDGLMRGERTYLKLDVQGLELDVLRGAVETLRDVVAVEPELSIVELYQGQALLPEVVGFLERHGFTLIHLEPGFSDARTGAILQLDGIFVRTA